MKAPEHDSPRMIRRFLIIVLAIVMAMFAWRAHGLGLNHRSTALAVAPNGHPTRVAPHQG
jgi:hypothetical protein